MKDDTITYGEFIKRRRTLLNLKQSDLAKFLSLSTQTISKYENSQLTINLEVLNELLKVLKIDITSFINKEVNAPLVDINKNFNLSLFAKSLKYYRKVEYISLTDLSKATKIHRNKLTKLENGECDADIEKFIKLANYFHISYENLFYSNNSNLFFSLNNNSKNENKYDFNRLFKTFLISASCLFSISLIFLGANSSVFPTYYKEASNDKISENFSSDDNLKNINYIDYITNF